MGRAFHKRGAKTPPPQSILHSRLFSMVGHGEDSHQQILGIGQVNCIGRGNPSGIQVPSHFILYKLSSTLGNQIKSMLVANAILSEFFIWALEIVSSSSLTVASCTPCSIWAILEGSPMQSTEQQPNCKVITCLDYYSYHNQIRNGCS